MPFSLRFLVCALVWFLGLGLERGYAEMINYQGRLSIHGVPFEGVGRFRFAVMNETRALWLSSELKVHVSKGEYSVRLGDSAQAPSIDGELLRQSGQPPRLRIWFAREGEAWVKAGADVPLDMHLVTPELVSRTPSDGGAVAGSPVDAAPASPFVTLHVAGGPSLGSEKAPLTLVEFTDLRSPACARFQSEVLPRLKSAYIDTGKLRLITRVLPSSSISPEDSLARAAWCAHAQGKFWAMRERLFAAGGSLSAEAVTTMSQEAQLDSARFGACFTDAQSANAVLKEQADAVKAGITTVPAFVLGSSAAGMVAGVRLDGEFTYERLAAEIEKNLASEGRQ
ncbi:thioredoxin domain-containing protein [Roseimicrobium sp. ORNL1]|uniref:DsbA family protein n=1 Tax=Roseimicrobium sp. ORNL1 TaxID=2711231 RepID=UPI0013E1DF0E|nr:thioredoxin domain-containing protein [Roseimicrobium sp. ORNL1]QIF05181.1 thioredoxin domain-containing protein [Roseimicrobium sp. ORNL1]